jgi:dCTP deaminase
VTTLPDWQIQNAAHDGLIVPFNPDQLNPTSHDVLLGGMLLIESAEGPELVPYPLQDHTEAEPYLLRPGQFVLAQTMETFNLPDTIAAEFRLKSSRARSGLDQALAVWCDPGWHGSVLTLELRNNRQLHPVPLWPGMRIGQMVFHRMEELPLKSYRLTGRYNGDQVVTASRG